MMQRLQNGKHVKLTSGMMSKILKIAILLVVTTVLCIILRLVEYHKALPAWKAICTSCMKDIKSDKAHIPKHIHQVFFFVTDKTLPEKYVAAQETWLRHNPGFGYTLWNTTMVDTLIQKKYPHLEKLYNSYDHWVKRADMARYLILHQYGGIYIDMDIKCKKGLSALNDTLPYNTSIVLRLTDPWGPSNDFIWAVPQHDFFSHVINGLEAGNRWYVVPYATTIFSTGPMFLWGRLINYPFKEVVYVIDNVTEYLDLMHGSSWHSWDGVFIWWIFNLPTYIYIFMLLIVIGTFVFCVRRYRQRRANILTRR